MAVLVIDDLFPLHVLHKFCEHEYSFIFPLSWRNPNGVQISGPRDAPAVDEIIGRHTDRFERLMLAVLPVLADPDSMLAKFSFDAVAQDTKRAVKRGLMMALANVVGCVGPRWYSWVIFGLVAQCTALRMLPQ